MNNQASHDDQYAAIEMLAGLTGANADQTRLVRILTNPGYVADFAYGGTPMDIFDWYEENFTGYKHGDDLYEAQQVAQALSMHYDTLDDRPDFGHAYLSGPESPIEMFEVTATFRTPTDWVTLSYHADRKHCTYNREADGFAAALAYAQALDDIYQRLAAQGARYGITVG